jgi:hypothetical protein
VHASLDNRGVSRNLELTMQMMRLSGAALAALMAAACVPVAAQDAGRDV